MAGHPETPAAPQVARTRLYRKPATNETVSMADRQLWNVRCTAHRSDGLPCGAWSIRGGYVCRVHGGRAPQVRARAEFRLWRAGIWNRAGARLAISLQALNERWRADPGAAAAEELAWLRTAGERLAGFNRVNGREPRTSELELILWPDHHPSA